MPVRLEAKPDGTIEVMRVHEGNTSFLHYDSLARALNVVEYFMKLEVQAAVEGRYIPQLEKDASKAYKQLEAKSPYDNSKR
ncbi:MAG: hypothetical protein WC322_04860 [Candidatus Paceibacterota bacterium]|jgi:hypothetical protein